MSKLKLTMIVASVIFLIGVISFMECQIIALNSIKLNTILNLKDKSGNTVPLNLAQLNVYIANQLIASQATSTN